MISWASPEPAGQFQPYLVQIILSWRELKFVQIKSQVLFKEEMITKMHKIELGRLKLFSSRTI
jgi:hypothetical protein